MSIKVAFGNGDKPKRKSLDRTAGEKVTDCSKSKGGGDSNNFPGARKLDSGKLGRGIHGEKGEEVT